MAKEKLKLLTDVQFENLLKQLKVSYSLVDDIDLSIEEGHGSRCWITQTPSKFKFICHCEDGKGKEMVSEFCPKCGNGVYREPVRLYASDFKEASLSDLTVSELKELAKEKGLKNYSKMNKEELIKELEDKI